MTRRRSAAAATPAVQDSNVAQAQELLAYLNRLGDGVLPSQCEKLLLVLAGGNSDLVSCSTIRRAISAPARRGPLPQTPIDDRTWTQKPVSKLKHELVRRLGDTAQLVITRESNGEATGYRLDRSTLRALVRARIAVLPVQDRREHEILVIEPVEQQSAVVHLQPVIVLAGPAVFEYVHGVLPQIAEFLRKDGAVRIYCDADDHELSVAIVHALEKQLCDQHRLQEHFAVVFCQRANGLPGVMLLRQGPDPHDQHAFIVQERAPGRRGPKRQSNIVPWTLAKNVGDALHEWHRTLLVAHKWDVFHTSPDFSEPIAQNLLEIVRHALEKRRQTSAMLPLPSSRKISCEDDLARNRAAR